MQDYKAPHSIRIPSSNHDQPSILGDEDAFTDAGLECFPPQPTIEDTEVGTIYLTGLTTLTTYKDLTSSIRGGALMNLTLNPKGRTATFTMLHGATDFLTHVKRHDLYVASKRLSARPASHQFKLSEHVRRQVLAGATRNLRIRNGAPRFTEQGIREDMAHIDGLIIIAVVFKEKDVIIETNSVHAALFARTCMLSRREFKGVRVEHYEDECEIGRAHV